MYRTSTHQRLLRIALLLAPACAHCTLNPASPDFQALIPTTKERSSTLIGAPHRPGDATYTESSLLTTSRAPPSIPRPPSEQTTLLETLYEPAGLESAESTATLTTLPITYTRTFETTTSTAAPALPTLLQPLRPSTNETQGEIHHAKPIGPIAGLWAVIALAVAAFLGWLVGEIWRDLEEMLWLKRELKRPRLLWSEEVRLIRRQEKDLEDGVDRGHGGTTEASA
jgi:hypothetical protein